MVYQASVKKRKNGLILKIKITYYKRKKITSSFSLSKISSTITFCLSNLALGFFLSLKSLNSGPPSLLACPDLVRAQDYKSSDPKICPILVKVSFSPSIQSNEVQWFPCPSPVLSLFNTLYERAGAFYITHFT
ncbi:hypothetical protein AMTRI_Chr03g142380 [Amborella trichopoda]